MSGAKFTPGPWLVSQSAARFAVPGCHSAAQDEANAKLIAAAPEMAEALRAIYAEVRDDGEGERPYSSDSYLPGKFQAQICAALAKAGL